MIATITLLNHGAAKARSTAYARLLHLQVLEGVISDTAPNIRLARRGRKRICPKAGIADTHDSYSSVLFTLNAPCPEKVACR